MESILTNEKYKGDARLQKTFTVDFLQKKTKINEGEVPQYYVESSHEAIIAPQLFDRVQEEMARRKILGRTYSGKSIFSCRLICADCGHYLCSASTQPIQSIKLRAKRDTAFVMIMSILTSSLIQNE